MREYQELSDSLKKIETILKLGPEALVKHKFLVEAGEKTIGDAVQALFEMGRKILGEDARNWTKEEVLEMLRKKRVLTGVQLRKMKKLLQFGEAIATAKSSSKEAILAREVHLVFKKIFKDLQELSEVLCKNLPFEIRG